MFQISIYQPSEQDTYADIEAAYGCLEDTYGVKEEDIILYGQSVGSGPTLELASCLPRLRAVILHSPILSGLRVMYPVKRTFWFDIYKVFPFVFSFWLCNVLLKFCALFIHGCFFLLQNIDKIPLVNCPVLVIHVSI